MFRLLPTDRERQVYRVVGQPLLTGEFGIIIVTNHITAEVNRDHTPSLDVPAKLPRYIVNNQVSYLGTEGDFHGSKDIYLPRYLRDKQY